VTKVGPGVVGFAAGDEVIGFTDRRGHTLGKIVLLP
jgi:NADPH:quinone reductase-like Zn-dependent oxidoreductase